MRLGIDGNEANTDERVGSNVYAYELLSWFHKLDTTNDLRVYLKTSPLPDLPHEREKWNYRVLGPSLLWTRWRLPLDLYLHKPRPGIFFTPGHYAPKYCPTRLAISIMDLSFLSFPEMFRKRDLYKLVHWTADSIRRADLIFTISEFSKHDIIKHYNVPEEKIRVTYPGIDAERYSRSIAASEIELTKRKYAIDTDYILYLGTLQPRKNLVRLIRAFSQSDASSLKLVISGKKGWLYDEILKEGKRLDIQRRIIFTDYLKPEETPALVKGAKAVILVSLYEGFGLPIAEAMALGTPAVVSNTSSLPETIGDVGIKVDPLDVKSIARGINQAIQLNESQRNNILVKSKQRSNLFSWEACARKTLEGLYALAV